MKFNWHVQSSLGALAGANGTIFDFDFSLEALFLSRIRAKIFFKSFSVNILWKKLLTEEIV